MTDERLVDSLYTAAEEGAAVALEGFRTRLDVETKDGRFDRVTAVDRAVQSHVRDSLVSTADVPFVGEEGDDRKHVPDRGLAWIVDPIDGTNNFVGGGPIWAVAVAAARDGEPVAAVTRLPVVGDTYVVGDSVAVDDPDDVDERGPGDAIPRRNGHPIRVSDRSDPESVTVNPIFGFSDRHRRHHRRVVETVFDGFGDVRRIGCAQAALAGVASGEIDAAVSTVVLNPWDTMGGVRLVRAAGGTVTDVHGKRWMPDSEGLMASNGEVHGALIDAFSDGGIADSA